MGDSPLFVEEKIIDMSDGTVDRVDMKTADLTCLVEHKTIVGNFTAIEIEAHASRRRG